MFEAELDIDKIFYSIDNPQELHEVKTLSGTESDTAINFSIDNLCMEMFKVKFMPGAEPDIDMKPSSIENFCIGLKMKN